MLEGQTRYSGGLSYQVSWLGIVYYGWTFCKICVKFNGYDSQLNITIICCICYFVFLFYFDKMLYSLDPHTAEIPL